MKTDKGTRPIRNDTITPSMLEEAPLDRLEEAEAKSVSLGLLDLVHYLNLPEEKLTGLGKQLQDEVIKDITHIIESNYPFDHLVSLVSKINDMGFRSQWHAGWADPISGDRLQYQKSSKLGRDQRILKIAGQKMVICRELNYVGDAIFDENHKRNSLHGTIIMALEDGTFAKIKRCKRGECRKFFIVDRLSDKFCTPQCSGVYWNGDSNNRMRKYRNKEKQKEIEQAKQATERKGFRRFSKFMELALKRRRTREEGHWMHPILCDLGKGDAAQGWEVINEWDEKLRRGASIKEIWRELDPQKKEVFEAA